MEKTCAKCGNTDEADIRFCTKCGEPYEMPREEDDFDIQSTRVNIQKAEIVEKWFASIGNASGEGEHVVEDFMKRVRDSGVPSITVALADLNTGLAGKISGFLKGVAAKAHEFVEIQNKQMPGYVIYAGARDYGNLLIISWFLVADERKVNYLGRHLAKGLGGNLLRLSIFETEELSAFASVAHQAMKDATEEMMKGKHLDFTTVNTHTSGILNLDP
jgi:hypothetical protein